MPWVACAFVKPSYFNCSIKPLLEKEQAEILAISTGNRPIMSQFSAIKRRGLSDNEVEAELERIAEETAGASPAFLTSIDTNLTLDSLRGGSDG